MVFHAIYQGRESRFSVASTMAIVGRRREGSPPPHVDLTPDAKVSRPHAKVWTDEKGRTWIEDLGSKRGTHVQGRELGQGESCELPAGEPVLLGETTLKLELDLEARPTTGETPSSLLGVPAEDLRKKGSGVTNVRSNLARPARPDKELETRLAVLCRLPEKLAAESRQDSCARVVVDHLIELLPGTQQAAFLFAEEDGVRPLPLKASAPKGARNLVSETLARRALGEKTAFVWVKKAPLVDHSTHDLGLTSAVYAPVTWGDEVLGVICASSTEPARTYTEADRLLLTAAAEFAGATIGRHRNAAQLQQQAVLSERLFGARFPPALGKQILRRAANDTLMFGTRESEVTILNSDIRGFTRLSAEIGAKRMNDLLNEYFPAFIDEIFGEGGSIERVVGDAIFAVFGAPVLDNERHDDQHVRALRAALQMQMVVAQMNEKRRRKSAATCDLGIGIDCGRVLHGFVGNAERMEFTVIGDAANYSQRYCTAAKPGQIVISQEVYARVWKTVDAEEITFEAKHEGRINAHLVHGLREKPAAVGG